MITLNFRKRKYAEKTRKMMTEFANGKTAKELGKKYGMSTRQAEIICARSPAADDIGEAPEICRLGRYMNFKTLIETVLRKYGVTWKAALGQSRAKRLVLCRWECFAVLSDAGKKYTQIAEFFGKDHTTVLYGCKQFKMNKKPHYFSTVEGKNEKADNCGQTTQRGQEGSGKSSRAA